MSNEIQTSDPPLDFIIEIDRSIEPIYPECIKRLGKIDRSHVGPTQYDLSEVSLWFHPKQISGAFLCKHVHAYLLETYGIAQCLNLQDGLAIQAKGLEVFRHLFKGKEIFLWGSVLESRNGFPFVPYLYERQNAMNGVCEVVLGWNGLGDICGQNRPALRFSNSTIDYVI
ncbi:MAG: hypothetical protein V4699_01350 [Patescibacteria group bacterium]